MSNTSHAAKFDTPENTSVNTEEFVPSKNVIPFAPELIDLILADKKLTTYRFGKKYDYLQSGDNVKIQNSATKECVGTAIIVNKTQTIFKDVPVKTAVHESYRDKGHQRQVLSGYYAYIGREIQDDDPFLIFEFRLI